MSSWLKRSTSRCRASRPVFGSWKLGVVWRRRRTAQQPPIQRAPGTLNEGVTAVLVDVVVRDRRGLPVRDLTQADFQIFEDGVAQPLGSFTPIVERKSGPAAPAAADPPPRQHPPVRPRRRLAETTVRL